MCVLQCFDDPECYQYVDGTALHWYADWWTSPDPMDDTHNLYPEKYMLYTESCDGRCYERLTENNKSRSHNQRVLLCCRRYGGYRVN